METIIFNEVYSGLAPAQLPSESNPLPQANSSTQSQPSSEHRSPQFQSRPPPQVRCKNLMAEARSVVSSIPDKVGLE